MLKELREANSRRTAEWFSHKMPLSFWGNNLAGEVGEACNIIKKIERAANGFRGSTSTVEELTEELADVIISVDIIGAELGVDLEAAVRDKFNNTSINNGLETML